MMSHKCKRKHITAGVVAVRQLLEVIDTPRALSIAIGLRYEQLIVPKINPIDYTDPYSYRKDAQAVALVKKNPWILPVKADAESAAYSKFLAAELNCSKINTTFSSVLNQFQTRTVLETARNYCERILGSFFWGEVDFGPGSSFLLKGKDANIVRKLRTKPECTPLAHDLVLELILDKLPHYTISCGIVHRDRGSVSLVTRRLPIVPGNRLSFVPKTVEEARTICIEPLGNLLAQKAVGSAIRSRLRSWGLDLGQFHIDGVPNEAQLLHRELARESSISGINATIDLSAASDSVSVELVKYLLPFEWYDVLRRIRSPKTELPDGSSLVNEKISSMGNGFTFELESLIFYSLALAVRYHYGHRDDTVRVYGDDIICSSATAHHLISLLEVCGFTTNKEKTFVTGPFRESCGGDFFNGVNVRPIFLKELSNENDLLFKVALLNRIREIAKSDLDGYGLNADYYPVYRFILHGIRKKHRCYGPEELGDSVIQYTGFRHQSVSQGIANGTSRVKQYVKVSRNREIYAGPDHTLACALYGIRNTKVKPGKNYVVRERYTTTVVRQSCVACWIS